jgi:hypothetical protein
VFTLLGICQDKFGAKWAFDGRVGSERRTTMCATEIRITSYWKGRAAATAEIRHVLVPFQLPTLLCRLNYPFDVVAKSLTDSVGTTFSSLNFQQAF